MIPQYLIRPFDPADAGSLADLHRRAILAVPDRFYSLADKQSWAHGISEKGVMASSKTGRILVASGGTGPVGFCGIAEQGITALYVAPEMQGQGAGSVLLAHAEAALCDAGVPLIKVEASLSAVAFYERHGYETHARRQWRTRGGRDIRIWRMEKRL